MKIKWYGQAAFRLIPDTGPTIITDPYTPELLGYAPITDTADLVIRSSDDDTAHCRSDLILGDPIVVNGLEIAQSGGLVNAAGVSISAVEAAECDDHPDHDVPGKSGMSKFTLDGMVFAHMGDMGNDVTEDQLAFFEGVDVLFALTGGHPTTKLSDLRKIIDRANPSLVIPMHFRTLVYKPRAQFWVETFLNEYPEEQIDFAFGCEAEVSKASLPFETRVLALDYAR